jgi:hypothetical protein
MKTTRSELKHQKKNQGRLITVSMPTLGRVDTRFHDILKEYRYQCSYMFRRLAVMCDHFLIWCYDNNEWPALNLPCDRDGHKTKGTKDYNQTLFRHIIKLGKSAQATS